MLANTLMLAKDGNEIVKLAVFGVYNATLPNNSFQF